MILEHGETLTRTQAAALLPPLAADDFSRSAVVHIHEWTAQPVRGIVYVLEWDTPDQHCAAVIIQTRHDTGDDEWYEQFFFPTALSDEDICSAVRLARFRALIPVHTLDDSRDGGSQAGGRGRIAGGV